MCAVRSVESSIMDLSKKLLFSKGMHPPANLPDKAPILSQSLNHFNFLALMQNHYHLANSLENQIGLIKLPPTHEVNADQLNTTKPVHAPPLPSESFMGTNFKPTDSSKMTPPFDEPPIKSTVEYHKSLRDRDSIKMLPHRKRPFNYESISDDEISKVTENSSPYCSFNLSPVSQESRDHLHNSNNNDPPRHLSELPPTELSKKIDLLARRPPSKSQDFDVKFNENVYSKYDVTLDSKFDGHFDSKSNGPFETLYDGHLEANTCMTKVSNGQMKDDSYWERRRKNNEAAKRSRDTRRQKEEDIAKTAQMLAEENLGLKAQIKILKNELNNLHSILFYHTRPANE